MVIDGGSRRGVVRCAAAAALFGATTPLASRLAVAVGAGGLLGPLLLTAGLARTPAATASLLLNLELVATTVLAAVLFHEHIGRRVGTGTVAVVAAGVVLAWNGSPEPRLGALLIAGACVCWGLDNCVTADLDEIAPGAHHPRQRRDRRRDQPVDRRRPGSRDAVARCVARRARGRCVRLWASITLWVAGARDIGAARGQLVFASAPFVGVTVAWVILGDSIRTAEIVALGLAAFGVSRVVGSHHLHEHHHDAIEHAHEHAHDDGHHNHHHVHDQPARHTHRHRHEPLQHAHPHVPDLHHRHAHAESTGHGR